MSKIAVIYYSLYNHTKTLAEEVAKGARENGAHVDIYQVAETLPQEVIAKMHGAPKADYPVITPDTLKEYDGFIFGIPTRYGRAVAQVSQFFDQTGGLWASGALVGKFGGVFTGSAGQHGGQETTVLTTIPFFVHHGINFVPIGYGAPELSDNSEIVGGSPYGAASISNGDGSRGLTTKELSVGLHQGKHFANIVNTFVRGKSASATGSSSATPVAGREQPATVTQEKPVAAAEPYDVPAPVQTTTAAAPAAAAVVAPKTETAAAPAAQTAQPKQKKGGLFSCCGGSNMDS